MKLACRCTCLQATVRKDVARRSVSQWFRSFSLGLAGAATSAALRLGGHSKLTFAGVCTLLLCWLVDVIRELNNNFTGCQLGNL